MTSDELRGLSLAGLMVLSVFATTVAFTGAAGAAVVGTAVEYDEGTIEIPTDNTTANVSTEDVTVTVSNTTGSFTPAVTNASNDDGRIVVEVDADPTPVDTVTVEIPGINEGEPISVTPTGATVDLGTGTADSPIYAGTPVAVVTNTTGATIDVLRDGARVVTRGTGPASQVYVYDSGDAEVGPTYTFAEQDGNSANVTFSELDLRASPPEEAARGQPFTVTATASDIDRQVVFQLLDPDGEPVETAGAVDIARLDADGVAEGTVQANETGNFSVRVTDANSGISATTDEFEVVAAPDVEPGVSFAQALATDQRGDVIPITVDLLERESANVTIGSDDVNFVVSVEVTDDDGDGSATLLFNTALSATLQEDANTTEETLGRAIDVESGEITDAVVVDGVTQPVEPAEYPLFAVDDQGDEAVGTLIVEERETTNMTSYTALGGALSGASSLEEITATIGTEDSEVTTLDSFVLQVEASGLYGYLETNEAASLAELGDDGLSVNITETPDTVGRNEDANTWNVTGARLVTDADNETFYLVFPGLPDDVSAGEEYVANFTVGEGNNVTEGTEEVSTTFAVVAPSLTVDRTGETLVLPPSEQATVSGTSNLPPGAEVRVRLRSIGGETPFTVATEPPVEVQPDGTWNATFNLSEVASGQEFTATVTAPGSGIDPVELTGEVANISAQVSMSDQQAQDAGSLVVVDSVELSRGGFVAIHEGSASGPVIGWSDYLEPGTSEDVQIRLAAGESVTGTQTLVAMAHRDTDGDRTFDFLSSNGTDDGPYMVNGSAVVDPAEVTLEAATPTPTPTPEETPTPTPEETPTPTETPTDDGIPGFGLVVAVVALLAAALLAAARRRR